MRIESHCRTDRAVFLLMIVTSLTATRATLAQESGDTEAKEGFVSLFNGKDFTGWRFGEMIPDGPETWPANWKVADGVIQVTGGNRPHLATLREYGDFDLRIQWRALRDKYNSGLFIRSGRNVNANQINLNSGAIGKLMRGATGGDPVPALQKSPGEWNDWRVVAVGDRVMFYCNGQRPGRSTASRIARDILASRRSWLRWSSATCGSRSSTARPRRVEYP